MRIRKIGHTHLLAIGQAVLIIASAIGEGPGNAFQPGLIATFRDASLTISQVAPTPNFTLNAEQSLHPQLLPEFKATWTGFLKVIERANYTIRGSARILVNGKDAGGTAIDLGLGEHSLQIEYTRSKGPARLQLTWESEKFEREPIPPAAFVHRGSLPDEKRFARLELGRRLVEDLNCVGCHQAKSNSLKGRSGPDLSSVGSRAGRLWLVSWLKNPKHNRNDATMPVLLKRDEDIRDVTLYLSSLKHPRWNEASPKKPNPKRIQQGKDLFNLIGCIACHGKGGISLANIGKKSNVEALKRYLLNPHEFHFGGRMPAMFNIGGMNSRDEDNKATLIAEYLFFQNHSGQPKPSAPTADLKDKDVEDDIDIEKELSDSSGGDPARGEQLVYSSGCLSCHLLKPPANARATALGLTKEKIGIRQSGWKLIGPFDSKNNYKTVYPPETKVDLQAEYKAAGGKMIRWKDADHFRDGRSHSLFGQRNRTIAYLYRTIKADEDTTVRLYIGSDDQIIIWVNGEVVFDFSGVRGIPAKKDEVDIQLKKGKNWLLMKVVNAGGGYGFYYRMEYTGYRLPPVPPRHSVARDFASLDESKGCLSETLPAGLPDYGLDKVRRGSIRAFLASNRKHPDVSDAPIHAFYRKVEKLRCNACHDLNGRKALTTFSPDPPPLTGVANKLRSNWIDSILNHGRRFRPWLSVRMPHFGPEHTAGMAKQLMAVSGTSPESRLVRTRLKRKELFKGMKLLSQSGLSCVSCHDYRGHMQKGGERGRELTQLHESLRPDWFRRWMLNPGRIRPGTPMPAYFMDMPEPKTNETIDALWRVLSMGKNLPAPIGVKGQDHVISVTDEPKVFRTYIPGSGARSIAVGLPDFVNYAFDAEACQLRFAWKGNFLDVARVWGGRGGNAASVIGERFYVAGKEFPIRIAEPGKQLKAKFRGYRLEKGLPTFLYEVDGVAIQHRIGSNEKHLGLVHVVELDKVDGPVYFLAPEQNGIKVSASAGEREGQWLKFPGGNEVKFQISISVEEK